MLYSDLFMLDLKHCTFTIFLQSLDHYIMYSNQNSLLNVYLSEKKFLDSCLVVVYYFC